MYQLHAASPGYSDGVTMANKKIKHERKVYKRECGILKDIFFIQAEKTQNKKSQKSVEIHKLCVFSVVISKLIGPKITKYSQA